MNNLNDDVSNLFYEQISNWELARINYEGLKTVLTKSFSFGDFKVIVQFNPARIISSGAKMDAKTIAERKCFLCAENLPIEQKGIDTGNYTILVNPFPIFPQHFTIPYKEHIDQQIKPYFADMLELAKALDDYIVFYNGPRCGASAPDHMHFQAGTKNFLPLISDYKRLKQTHGKLLEEGVDYQFYELINYNRTVYCIESDTIFSAQNIFENLYSKWQDHSQAYSKGNGPEPMMNIVCSFEDGIWHIFLFPRKAFRPWQYTADEKTQILISPATVEMSGILITPIESHFERITKEDVQSIFEQCS
jgi:ATP adenylyltransferase/5',5'''-P-1,P-4-tetraphosphate phosphorylase II